MASVRIPAEYESLIRQVCDKRGLSSTEAIRQLIQIAWRTWWAEPLMRLGAEPKAVIDWLIEQPSSALQVRSPRNEDSSSDEPPTTIVLADGSEVSLLRFGRMYCATTEKGLAIWGRTKAEVVLFSGMTLKPVP